MKTKKCKKCIELEASVKTFQKDLILLTHDNERLIKKTKDNFAYAVTRLRKIQTELSGIVSELNVIIPDMDIKSELE